ncbi:MAG: class I SAM-dependent methyltransferase [Dichotomicrobium sp.]
MSRSEKFRDIAAHTRDIYERNAARFDAERVKSLIERKWLARFCALLPAGGSVLDVGCGTGDPIARDFIERGYGVTGVDFSEAMLAVARARCPDARWLCADMRRLALGETFDGIVGWHSFFHLTPDEQASTLTKLAAHLAPGGALMLTVGPEAGEVTGHVGDEVVYHASLSRRDYELGLAALGLRIVEFTVSDDDCGGATVLLARKQKKAA